MGTRYNILGLLRSPSSVYVIFRYGTYIVQFLNSILLAKALGDIKYGIYSFVFLIMQYMSYSNLGINESLNTEYAVSKDGDRCKIWNTSWALNLLINTFLFMVFAFLISIVSLFSRYEFDSYGMLLLMTCIVINLSRIYITYYKLHGKLIKLNIQQFLPHFVLLVLVLIMWNKLTVRQIVVSYFVSNVIALIIFRVDLPNPPSFQIDRSIASVLLRRGITLLLYNLSFYLLTLVASSLVSSYFSLEEFGCYSFVNTLIHGIIMACGAFLFIFYPKILNRLYSCDEDKAYELISRIRGVYILFIDLVSLLSIFVAVVLSYLLPQYRNDITIIFPILILGQIIMSSTTGHSAYLLSKKKEFRLVVFGFESVVLTLVLGILCGEYFNSLYALSLVVPISSLFYTFMTTRESLATMNKNHAIADVLKEIFALKKWFPCVLVLIYAFVINLWHVILIGVGIYLFINYKNLRISIKGGVRIISDRNSLLV
mgnify:FL=1